MNTNRLIRTLDEQNTGAVEALKHLRGELAADRQSTEQAFSAFQEMLKKLCSTIIAESADRGRAIDKLIAGLEGGAAIPDDVPNIRQLPQLNRRP